jgi:hypothetical protein
MSTSEAAALPVIANADARRWWLALQRLSGARPPASRAGLGGLIEALGYVQVDSINTVARAHDLILFQRQPGYRPAWLAHLLERERALFENWTHDAAIVPCRFYPYWVSRFARAETRLVERWRKWRRDGFEARFDEVLEGIRAGGPVLARELGQDEPKTAGGWWDWHPSKTALEYLWRTGRLAVARREGFQKVYDLAERVIPAAHLGPAPDREAYVDWACSEALARLGFAGPAELADFWGDLTAAEAAAWAQARLGGPVTEVLVEPAAGKPWRAFALPGAAEIALTAPPAPGRIRVLSPFDPLIRNRTRTARLFGFDYRIEVFVPEAQRRYGYYVFPLLEGERFAGRIDMRHLSREGVLRVAGLWLEPRLKPTSVRLDRLGRELDRIARFVGAERIEFADGYLKA